MNEIKQKLKLCPFCGNRAVLEELSPLHSAHKWMVTCPNGHRVFRESSEQAVNAWNQRLESAPMKKWQRIAYDWLQVISVFAGISIIIGLIVMMIYFAIISFGNFIEETSTEIEYLFSVLVNFA